MDVGRRTLRATTGADEGPASPILYARRTLTGIGDGVAREQASRGRFRLLQARLGLELLQAQRREAAAVV